jgi:hypothetical protein
MEQNQVKARDERALEGKSTVHTLAETLEARAEDARRGDRVPHPLHCWTLVFINPVSTAMPLLTYSASIVQPYTARVAYPNDLLMRCWGWHLDWLKGAFFLQIGSLDAFSELWFVVAIVGNRVRGWVEVAGKFRDALYWWAASWGEMQKKKTLGLFARKNGPSVIIRGRSAKVCWLMNWVLDID